MNLKKLEVLYYAAKYQNFSQAANKLLVTLPAVSMQIRDLEEYYNVKLFIRRGNQVKLTEAGEALYDYAEKIFVLAGHAENYLMETGNINRSTLRIGAEETGAKYVLPHYLKQLRKEFPHIKVIVKIGVSSQMTDSVANHENDLAFVGTTKPKIRLPSIRLYQSELFLVISKKHHWFKEKKEVSLEDLKKERILLSGDGTAIKYTISNLFKKHHIKTDFIMEGDTIDFIKEMVKEGEGVAFLPFPPIRGEIKQGIFRALPISGEKAFLDLRIYFLDKESLSPPAKRLIQILKTELKG